MSRQDSSDPMPYVQVDRAVKPKATLLASALGVTTQHALGSLIEWWELCGDPRELEKIVASTPPGEQPKVVLKGDDASMRFLLASGKTIEPVLLVRLGLLEELPDGYRVRGMSRQFEPIQRRMTARAAAVAGGIASADARRKANGTAQPIGGKGSKARSESRSTDAQPNSEAQPKREPNRNGTDDRSGTEADPTPRGQRSAVRDHLLEEEGKKPASAADFTGEAFFAWAQDRRAEAGFVRDRPPPGLGAWFSRALSETNGDLERLRAGWRAFTVDPHWRPKNLPWAGWLSQWERFVPPAASPQAPPCVVPKCKRPGITGWHDLGVPCCHEHANEAADWCSRQELKPWIDAGQWRDAVQRLARLDQLVEKVQTIAPGRNQ